MRQAGLRGLAALPRPTRTTDSRHAYPIAPNRLGRNFVADRPSQVWLADLTYIATGGGWLYLAAVLDLHTVQASAKERPCASRAQRRLHLICSGPRRASGDQSDRRAQHDQNGAENDERPWLPSRQLRLSGKALPGWALWCSGYPPILML
jgi:transposase InsO family protein